jgi:hypothetical protein
MTDGNACVRVERSRIGNAAFKKMRNNATSLDHNDQHNNADKLTGDNPWSGVSICPLSLLIGRQRKRAMNARYIGR